MLHRIGGDRKERACNSPFAGNLAASDGINGHPAAVGRILDREPHFEVQRDFSKPSSFHPEKTDLVVILPGDIIGRTDVDILRLQRNTQLGLNRFGFGDPFVLQPIPVEHVEKIGIATRIDLVGSVQPHPAVFKEFCQDPMDDGRAHLGFDIVSDGRDSFLFKPFRPPRLGDDETGHAVDEADAGA